MPQCSMDTVSVASVPIGWTLARGLVWGDPAPPPPLCPLSSHCVGCTWTLTPFFFLKDNGIKMKKLFGCVGLFHSGVRAVCCGCSVAGGILVPQAGLEPTAPAVEALDHQGSPFSLFLRAS